MTVVTRIFKELKITIAELFLYVLFSYINIYFFAIVATVQYLLVQSRSVAYKQQTTRSSLGMSWATPCSLM